MLRCSCFVLVSLVLATLFAGVQPKDVDGGYTEWSEWSKCPGEWCYVISRQRQSRTCTNPRPEGNGTSCYEQGLGNSTQDRECTPSTFVCVFHFPVLMLLGPLVVLCCFCYCTRREKARARQRFAEARRQQLNSVPRATLQGMCVSNATECQAPTRNPHEVLMVELPPLHPGADPPPPYSGEEFPPPYPEEQSPPTYPRGGRPSPPYTQGQSPPPYPEEQYPPPYPEEQSPPPYPQGQYPLSYPEEQSPPPYPREQSPLPFPQRQSPPYYLGEGPNSREEVSPPYTEEDTPYAVTTLV